MDLFAKILPKSAGFGYGKQGSKGWRECREGWGSFWLRKQESSEAKRSNERDHAFLLSPPRTPLDTPPPTESMYDKGGDETMQLGRLAVHGASGRRHHHGLPHLPTNQPTPLPLSTTGKQREDNEVLLLLVPCCEWVARHGTMAEAAAEGRQGMAPSSSGRMPRRASTVCFRSTL